MCNYSPLPSDRQYDDYKVALHIADQFGQLAQLSHLNGDDGHKKLEMSRPRKPDNIQQLLVRPVNAPDANVIKEKMVANPYEKVTTAFCLCFS